MNTMWMPNRRLGHYGKTNSGVVGDTHPSKSEMPSSLNDTRLQGIMVVVFIIYNCMYHAFLQARLKREKTTASVYSSNSTLH